MTITNQQVKLLMKKLKKHNQEISAAKSGMSANTVSWATITAPLKSVLATITDPPSGQLSAPL
jgi:hypothetical protein